MNTAAKQRWWFGAVLAVLLLAMGMMGVSCKPGNDAPPVQQGASQPAIVYTCPMHSQISEAKPGKCPICGMDLVQKK